MNNDLSEFIGSQAGTDADGVPVQANYNAPQQDFQLNLFPPQDPLFTLWNQSYIQNQTPQPQAIQPEYEQHPLQNQQNHLPHQQQQHHLQPPHLLHQGFPSVGSQATPAQIIQHQHQQPSTKQKRRKPASQSQRKRTLTACESCRIKKIKCDLGKPICGSCTKNGASCVYRSNNTLPVQNTESPSKLYDLDKRAGPPTWSSCNWFAQTESVLDWPCLRSKYKLERVNASLSKTNDTQIPRLSVYTTINEVNDLLEELKENLSTYMNSFISNVQTKNPFINLKNLVRSVKFIEKHLKSPLDGEKKLHNIMSGLKENSIPIELVVICCAIGLISAPLDFKNLILHKNSTEEKSSRFLLSYKLYAFALHLSVLNEPNAKEFNDLHKVQFYLLKATYWMYNMKPLKAWDNVYKGSITVMTIIETFKSSNSKFKETEHRILERVFHTCLKYECELRVELSPYIPSSGIVNYELPSIYPTPPLAEGLMDLNEELSWFYYLTEIVLRKLENRILDDFYVPTNVSPDDHNDEENVGKFLQDNYRLDWAKYDLNTVIGKVTKFSEDLNKIEVNIERHLKLILQEDQLASEFLQPHGLVFKSVKQENESATVSGNSNATPPSTSISNSSKTEGINDHSATTPSSETSSSLGSKLGVMMASNVKFPEVLNFIRTRMITLKLSLFRPVIYIILNDSSITVNDLVLARTDDEFQKLNPHLKFIKNLLIQCSETMDLINVPLAVHRHFGSWFYARNVLLSGVMCFTIYQKFGSEFCTLNKIKELLKNILIIFKYWIDESSDLLESEKLIKQFLEELETKT